MKRKKRKFASVTAKQVAPAVKVQQDTDRAALERADRAKKAFEAAVANQEPAPEQTTVPDLARDAGLALQAVIARLTPVYEEIAITNPNQFPIKFNVKEAWGNAVRLAC